ncbi:MAG: GCN5-related N-acetyltransferase [Panacagrimonas sp.]|nr:GNAT family N-acetyltransferase [Panacagrimonas sp.]MCC2657427.1 GCN5-related N-acetyltransferase [Panacagrimonas sp.]
MRWLKRKPSATPSTSAASRPTGLRTPRLHLRPLTDADIEPLHALWTQPAVRRFLWDDHVLSPEQTRDLVHQNQGWFEQHGYGLWAAHDGDGALVGFCGYGFFRDEHELELLYAVAEAQWMKGYAREMAEALVAYGFDTLRLGEIRASVDAPNSASQRVLKRLGFLPDTRRHGADRKLFFRLPRARRDGDGADWEAA